MNTNQSIKDIKLSHPNHTKALRNKTQLRIDQRSMTGVDPTHTHGLGCWGNPRIVFSVRVDSKLVKQFNLASQALFGSTCNAVESYMAGIVGCYQNQKLVGVNPSSTVSIGEIKIERNLRERRKVVVDRGEVAEIDNRCMIGSCDKLAVEVAVYQPKGKEAKELQICAYHASAYAGNPVWRLKR